MSLSRLCEKGVKRLCDIFSMEDVKGMSYAKSPGGHCPLFGVHLALKSVENITIVVVGTMECVHYAKRSAMQHFGMGLGKANVISVAVEDEDLIFGFGQQLKDLLLEIDKNDNVNCIFIVTSCTVEIIGEDIEGLLHEMQDMVKAKLALIHTEHFKTKDYYIGIENACSATVDLMEKIPEKPYTFNVLGARYPGIERSEVVRLLQKKGYEINVVFPYGTTWDNIKKIPCASFNLVTDYTGLNMAQQLKSKLGMRYCCFDNKTDEKQIQKSYKQLECIANINLNEETEQLKKRLLELKEQAKPVLEGKTFVYGHIILYPFDVTLFLSQLGMEPLLVQVRNIYQPDWENIKQLKQIGKNPFIAQNANLQALDAVYEELRPDIYLGSEYPSRLKKWNIKQASFPGAMDQIGYSLPISIIETITKIYEQQRRITA